MKSRPCYIAHAARVIICGLLCITAIAQIDEDLDVSGLSPIQAACVRLLDVSLTHKRAIDPVTYAVGRMTLKDAYGVQDRYCKLRNETTRGYKLAFASPESQKRWNIDAPISGQLLAGGKVEPDGTIAVKTFRNLLLEAEVVFTLAADIETPVVSVEALRAKTASVHLGLDIVDLPFSSVNSPPTVHDIVCANAAASHYVIGKPVSPEAAGDLSAIQITLTQDGNEVYSGAASNVMGDPWNALLWLSNHLIERGTPLRKGDIVLSGAVSAAYGGGAEGITGVYTAEGGSLGSVRVTVK